MIRFLSFLSNALLLCLVLGSAHGATLKDNSPGCDCYVTDGSSSSYFLYHRFFDFRDIRDSSGLYVEPANVTDQQSQGDEPGQQGYLNSTAFLDDWQILNWGKAAASTNPVNLQNSPQNVWIQANDDNPSTTYLALRVHRNTDFSSTAEVESLQKNLFHSSIRLRARVRGASGAVAGMFTILNDSTESDIEILTRDPPNHIRYTNQPSVDAKGEVIPDAETDATLPDSAVWTDWITHRIDWTPSISAWYVNDVFLANKTYGIPKSPSYLTLNMWSDGGVWSDNMTIGSAAYLEIQWIDMVFNTSGPVTGSPERRGLETRAARCGTVCAVDGVNQTGFPEVLHKAGSAASGLAVNNLLWLSFLVWWILQC